MHREPRVDKRVRPGALLVGRYAGAAPLERSTEGPQEIKSRTPL